MIRWAIPKSSDSMTQQSRNIYICKWILDFLVHLSNKSHLGRCTCQSTYELAAMELCQATAADTDAYARATSHLPELQDSSFHRNLGPWSLPYIYAVRNLPRLSSSLRRESESICTIIVNQFFKLQAYLSFVGWFKTQHAKSAPMPIALLSTCIKYHQLSKVRSLASRVDIRQDFKLLCLCHIVYD